MLKNDKKRAWTKVSSKYMNYDLGLSKGNREPTTYDKIKWKLFSISFMT